MAYKMLSILRIDNDKFQKWDMQLEHDISEQLQIMGAFI